MYEKIFNSYNFIAIKETCTENQFACCAEPQQCIDLSRRCDSHPDCSNGEDENNCPSCGKTEFACVKSGKPLYLFIKITMYSFKDAVFHMKNDVMEFQTTAETAQI